MQSQVQTQEKKIVLPKDKALQLTGKLGKEKKLFENFRKGSMNALLFAGTADEWIEKIKVEVSPLSGQIERPEDLPRDKGSPLDVFNSWRRRMQKFQSLTEQFRSPDCRAVIMTLHFIAKGRVSTELSMHYTTSILRAWKKLDICVTELANEARDIVKYLFTLSKFLADFETETPAKIVEHLPALFRQLQLVYCIAPYFATPERMSDLLGRISDQLVRAFKRRLDSVPNTGKGDKMFTKDPVEITKALNENLAAAKCFKNIYQQTKDSNDPDSGDKPWDDFDEESIFRELNPAERRMTKLHSLFSTIADFNQLTAEKIEGMNAVTQSYRKICSEFQAKRHDLFAYNKEAFDLDFTAFNAHINGLETNILEFIQASFEGLQAITPALELWEKYNTVFRRPALQAYLTTRLQYIFSKFGSEIERVQQLYEENKHSPPRPRNMPPVAGNISWVRLLFKRIEGPMKKFEKYPELLQLPMARKIIKSYNTVARALVTFEYLWYQAWNESLEATKAGLEATLIIRHPEDQELYVNFDSEILQLIRETKCLNRVGIEIPESARTILFQEDKFKQYYDDLTYLLREYKRVKSRVVKVVEPLLTAALEDLEYRLRPGMITLTWTSMNIAAFKKHVHTGLHRLDDLISTVNDIIENRIENNLRVIARTLLVDLPAGDSFTLQDFVASQREFISGKSEVLRYKSMEIEGAVEDLLHIARSYEVDSRVTVVIDQTANALYNHYHQFLYAALLACTKNSLNSLKARVATRTSAVIQEPFFEVDVQLCIPSVNLNPTLEEVQETINKASKAVLACSKRIDRWGQKHIPPEQRANFFSSLTEDIEVVRVVLLLTGSIQGVRNTIDKFLEHFYRFDWLWKNDVDESYKRFMETKPEINDYEKSLQYFLDTQGDIESIPSYHVIGALSMNTEGLKKRLKEETQLWMDRYSEHLHKLSRSKLQNMLEYMKSTLSMLDRTVDGINPLRYVMDVLKEIRNRQSIITIQINPILETYTLLERFGVTLTQDEMDGRSVLWGQWKKVVDKAENVTESIASVQGQFRRSLVAHVKRFKTDVASFHEDYVANGPMADGISPNEAMERLKRYEDKHEIMERKRQLYASGEELFALPITEYPELDETKKELVLLNKLYSLYRDVMNKMAEYKTILWIDVVANVDKMATDMEGFSARCKKMPKRLRTWKAYQDLNKEIEDFQLVLPLLQELSKRSIRPRHWAAVEQICGGEELHVDDVEFKLQDLLEKPLVEHYEEIEEVTISADKELDLENKIADIRQRWETEEITFVDYKTRNGVMVMQAVGYLVEELEEAQMNLQTFLTSRNVTPFREDTQELLQTLSDTSETLEMWLKVQLQWSSLEVVFLGGDIAKQMPGVAKKFQKLDKDFVNLMNAACKTKICVDCCSNEVLKSALPQMYDALENCQKHLDGYLEQKRNKFPRFYFCSGPVLLQILSKGSDPQAIQEFYSNVFDSIDKVEHDSAAKDKIIGMMSFLQGGKEYLDFHAPVATQGNIEEWLMDLLREMQRSMKGYCADCASEVAALDSGLAGLRNFVDNQCAQYALLGIQFLWTNDQETALESCKQKKNALELAKKKAMEVQRTMGSWCLQDLGSKMNRVKIETLVTIQVHQTDVSRELAALFKQRKVKSADDFEWLKQARFYWEPDGEDQVDDLGSCRISVTDVPFNYQYEYLGVKERLVITPLTDRCYITLAQALGMYFGGAPAGPAGTGKTETVKDMGRTLGIYVIVTNCSDQMRYTDCGKIFKGLCQSGLWGCFDEFNRIALPVLSVVAQQVLAVNNAKKSNSKEFYFPGDDQKVLLEPVCGFFITMNPGYAGRQELPENLKALFRGVAMMVPDREIIIKVKLVSVGYELADLLSKKFFICYKLCEEQLSKQRHYDFGLRNILSVLRTAGNTKRENLNASEEMLLYRTLRDMNLSKLIAQDVPLFLSMLEDLFPSTSPPPKADFPELTEALRVECENVGYIMHPTWVTKVIQLYETNLVRHGIMLSGPSGGGKTAIFELLQKALQRWQTVTHKLVRLNPKAVLAEELYGNNDPVSGEWVKGVFSSLWEKYNRDSLPYVTWLVEDGPVDSIWIESLNTVLDDNRLLTLSNGDRFPMTDNVKIMFENETLKNASPATVSRCGIVYVSDTDLDWFPITQAWLPTRPKPEQERFESLFKKYIGECSSAEPGHLFTFLIRNTSEVMSLSRVGMVSSFLVLLDAMLERYSPALQGDKGGSVDKNIERIFVFALTWSLGGILEKADRERWDSYMRKINSSILPATGHGTLYEYCLDEGVEWSTWKTPTWDYPQQEVLDFSNLLVPTMDTTRHIFLMQHIHGRNKPLLLLGGPGTAKTSTALMFFSEFDPQKQVVKRINFSSASTCRMFQDSIESELDKRGGKSFGPPGGKKMAVFIDDISMPEINMWGDQPTNEIVRQIIEHGGIYFLDKDKRGDFKICEDLTWVAAMTHPGGGKNDIANRLKRHFFVFNLVLPSITSIDDLYGQMLQGRFSTAEFSEDLISARDKITTATIDVWESLKTKMLPTPAKFHYIFNMRDLSRVFQGILLTPKSTILTGGQQTPTDDQATILLRLWRHECMRVFADKLVNNEEKAWCNECIDTVLHKHFGSTYGTKTSTETLFVDFFRDDVVDEEDVVIEEAPKIYEPGGPIDSIRERVQMFMENHNSEFPSLKLSLVLFEDALRHLLRINRILSMPRGSALLVGVGGSGKQSLTKLAAYIARSKLFQITLTKTYGVNALLEDIRYLFELAGHQRRSCTFLFTDSEIKKESFLEYINSILMTGEVAGLFAKDEIMSITSDLQAVFAKDRPHLPETLDNLKQYFIDCVRDNLHIVLCMSPVNAKFPERARKFPALISGTSIDWFLPWPAEALISVSTNILQGFKMDATPEVQQSLMNHMGMVHNMVVEVCQEYFSQMRRHVYQTPKSYLSFIENYKELYSVKLQQLVQKEHNVNSGLEKLIQGSKDVDSMKVVLREEQTKVEEASRKTNDLLANLEVKKAEAEQKKEKVSKIKESCEEDKNRIEKEAATCQADLDKAQPIVDRAMAAASSITPEDIKKIKSYTPMPPAGIQLVLDEVVILFQEKILPVQIDDSHHKVAGVEFDFLNTSFKYSGLSLVTSADFLSRLSVFPKDDVNEETVELLQAYTGNPYLDPEILTTKVSEAAGNLAVWAKAMEDYFYASRIVKPKLEALEIAKGKLNEALQALAGAENEQNEVLKLLETLQSQYQDQIDEKTRLEEGAAALLRKLEQAEALIGGLAGEKTRWTNDSKTFADQKKRLVGDCAIACAFICYCGPFNAPFRDYLLNSNFAADLKSRDVPHSLDLDVADFLVDLATVGDWNLEGLPTDPLSIQNGILVTKASRFPLLVDPQGQAVTWIRNREKDSLPRNKVTALNDSRLKDNLEFCMQEGKAFIVIGVEQELDPLLDPVLEKQFIVRNRRKYVKIADGEVEVHDDFRMYFITRLPNPHFSPELQAKTTVVDFTVTMKGLEDQLLGKVIKKEKKELEDMLNQVLTEVQTNRRSLMELDNQLLDRLSANQGNLLDDDELVEVLNNTKTKAMEVKEKLDAADETKKSISEQRESYRPVATRGSVLYFSIVEMSMVNVMYQTSLRQFVELFMRSIILAEKAAVASKRVSNIVETMTYLVYRYVNKGLYERHKILFVFIFTLKILVKADFLDASEVPLFLRAGAAYDIEEVTKKPKWISNDAWLNAIALSDGTSLFKSLPSLIARNENTWKAWYESNVPDSLSIPDYEIQLKDDKDLGPWRRFLLIRSLRPDRTILAVREFIRKIPLIGEKYVEPVTDTMEMIFDESTPYVPVIFLLSVGADPTDSIETHAKRKKTSVEVVSMGEGQEPVAKKAIEKAAVNGTWVLLQNCELGLGLMCEMEDILNRMKDMVSEDFRIWISAMPQADFPLGLLQMSTKVTNEPPAGLRANLKRSFTVEIDQDRLERIDSPQQAKMWRQLVFNMCFLHAVVQERRKFGPLGWNIPYEYNSGDLRACILFLERHLYSGNINWITVQYMVSEVQYGGKITDDMDRRLFNTYAKKWVRKTVLDDDFRYDPLNPIQEIPNNFEYKIFDAAEIEAYRNYASSLPEIDSPEIFGLHPNADLTFRVKEVKGFLSNLSDTQPKQAGGSGGQSLDSFIMEKSSELLGKLPADYEEDDYIRKIRQLGGLQKPLNIFLFQEIQRLQQVIKTVRHVLTQMQLAIKGEVVLTSELQESMANLFEAKVPQSWLRTPGGDEFSWLLPNLGMWVTSFFQRDDQIRGWLEKQPPNSYWMTGFFNPQGFLTAMKQEVTRAHKKEGWALDNVEYYSETTDYVDADSVREPPDEGVYVHGLFMEGARWDRKEHSIVESEAKQLFAPMPVIMITAEKSSTAAARASGQLYETPVYRYPTRTDFFLVLTIRLPTRNYKPDHWILRGVALLCITTGG